MLKTFKGKLVFGTLAITSIANLILTFYISKNLNLNLQNTIKRDMNNIKIMAVNNIKFNSRLIEEEDEKDIPWKTISDINSNFKCFVAMSNKDKELIDYSGKLYYEEPMLDIIKESKNEKSLLKLNKKDNYYLATYNYPIYIDGEFYSNLIVQNNYEDDFNNKNRTLTYIVMAQAILLIIISFVINNMINRMTYPLKRLTNDMRNFGEGIIVENIVISSSDEIGELSNSFNNMREEIKNQIDIIVEEKERVLHLQKLSKEFFNNATHELKTPITAISGYAQVLSENLESQDEFTKRALERTIKECEKMNVLVQNILDISRGRFNSEKK
ncbi:histidine kinase dimerization/phospho-acceptor domain-containing protein [Clostridium gasigenes]|uniref:histidine kinase dimerization/phospho-acceptor domain-containing protein n=1 Tax=Clostridium gasigenes TaxID=94869 RepID=UPI001C0BCE3D|nr:histidine kinase dimerization/phospho-acceptor domain-containing protein [Clostridium gasigenes]MBU3102786.1 HAMP domain-containing protein [Clostridium gasigenes]